VPPIDDAFAVQNRGLKSLLALRGAIREEIGAGKKEQAEKTKRAAVTHQLLLRNRFPLPTRTMTNLVKDRMKSYEESVGRYREQLGDDVVNNMLEQQRREQAQRTAQETSLFFIFRAIADAEELDVTDEEIEEKIDAMATEDGVQPAYVKAKLGDEGLEDLKFELRREKIIELVLERGVAKDYDEYLRLLTVDRKRRLLRYKGRRLVVRKVSRNLRRRHSSASA